MNVTWKTLEDNGINYPKEAVDFSTAEEFAYWRFDQIVSDVQERFDPNSVNDEDKNYISGSLSQIATIYLLSPEHVIKTEVISVMLSVKAQYFTGMEPPQPL